jgi:hypothetical protein
VKLETSVMRSIARRHSVVILRFELARLGRPAQLSRVLTRLVSAGALVRVSRGVYSMQLFVLLHLPVGAGVLGLELGRLLRGPRIKPKSSCNLHPWGLPTQQVKR